MLETLRSYWSIISTIITVVAVPAIGYLYKNINRQMQDKKRWSWVCRHSSVTASYNPIITMRSADG